jgi:hypothetical protein
VSVVVLAFVVGFAPLARIVAREHWLVVGGVVDGPVKRVLCQSRSHLMTPRG